MTAINEGAERRAFEAWYAMNAFNYERDPIGSRDCGLQWKAYSERAHIAAAKEEQLLLKISELEARLALK